MIRRYGVSSRSWSNEPFGPPTRVCEVYEVGSGRVIYSYPGEDLAKAAEMAERLSLYAESLLRPHR